MKLEHLSHTPDANADLQPTPILFVHGAWHGAWCWDQGFMQYFAKRGYNTHALSLRGHGTSEGGWRFATGADYVADVASIAATLPKPPVLIGHSMGGYLVQKYLETHDAPAAVLLASVPPSGAGASLLRASLHDPVSSLMANLTFDLYATMNTPAKAQHHLFSSREIAERYFPRLGHESVRTLLDMVALNLPQPAKVRTPMLVLGGEKDTVFTQDEVRATAKAYNTEAHFFPMPHDLMLDVGWERVADTILDWLKARGI
jgi:pimeloyl-ACP methyl ester carboxylesterase